jgi:hypothetical protein
MPLGLMPEAPSTFNMEIFLQFHQSSLGSLGCRPLLNRGCLVQAFQTTDSEQLGVRFLSYLVLEKAMLDIVLTARSKLITNQ